MYRGCKKCLFLEGLYYGRIFFTKFVGTFLYRLFSRYLFFLSHREKTPEKTPTETQSMKIQVKLGEMPVRKNVGKIMQNVNSCRVTSKSARLTCYSTLKIQSHKHGKRFEDIKK